MLIIPFSTLQLTDIEDCEISRKYDDEGFLRVFPQRLVRTVLIRHKVALKCGKLVCLTTQLRWEWEEKKVAIFFLPQDQVGYPLQPRSVRLDPYIKTFSNIFFSCIECWSISQELLISLQIHLPIVSEVGDEEGLRVNYDHPGDD